MKTDIDIKDDIYMYLRDTMLTEVVTGKLSKTLRPAGSRKEDIVISVLANNNAQIQEAYVNVNIYVPDVDRKGQAEEDTIRIRELSEIASEILLVGYKDDFRFVLESQRVYEVDGRNEHMINNKLLYKQVNE